MPSLFLHRFSVVRVYFYIAATTADPAGRDPRQRLKKNEEVLREMQDNMKCNNIRIIGIPEGEEEEQGIENLF